MQKVALFVILIAIAGCIAKKQSVDGLVYHTFKPLKQTEANNWVTEVMKYSEINYLYVTDKTFTDGTVQYNDSMMYFGLDPAVHWDVRKKSTDFAIVKKMGEVKFRKLLDDFNDLWSAYFYQEQNYLAFFSVVGPREQLKGYFYFRNIDLAKGKNAGDTLDLSEVPYKKFWHCTTLKFVIEDKIDDRWVAWHAVKKD